MALRPPQALCSSETLDFDPDALREKYRQERDRRLRPDANDQYVEIASDFRHYIDDPHVDPGFTRKPLTDAVDVVIVGARRPLRPMRRFVTCWVPASAGGADNRDAPQIEGGESAEQMPLASCVPDSEVEGIRRGPFGP